MFDCIEFIEQGIKKNWKLRSSLENLHYFLRLNFIKLVRLCFDLM